jgi:hypothetical protein
MRSMVPEGRRLQLRSCPRHVPDAGRHGVPGVPGAGFSAVRSCHVQTAKPWALRALRTGPVISSRSTRCPVVARNQRVIRSSWNTPLRRPSGVAPDCPELCPAGRRVRALVDPCDDLLVAGFAGGDMHDHAGVRLDVRCSQLRGRRRASGRWRLGVRYVAPPGDTEISPRPLRPVRSSARTRRGRTVRAAACTRWRTRARS